MLFKHDKEGNRISYTPTKTIKRLVFFLFYLLVTGALQSIMALHPNLAIFGQPVVGKEWFSPKRFLTWQLYANNLMYAGKLRHDFSV